MTQTEADGPAPFVPNEEWIEAFESQATDTLRRKAKRYARGRARGVGKAGGRVDEFYVGSLVQDALTDTLFGVLSWDPATVLLETHVLNTIKFRTRHDRVHALKFKQTAFDPSTASSAMIGEVEASLAIDHYVPSPEGRAFAGEVIEQLRDLAGTDALVLRLLSAFEEGATEKADVMHVAKMSSKAYHNARVRLQRLVAQLSNDVRTAARRA